MRAPTLALLLLALLLALWGAACDGGQGASASAPPPSVTYLPGQRGLVVQNPFAGRPTFFDFDRVPYGAQPRHVFRIRNEESVPVTISDLLPSCGCLKVTAQYTNGRGDLVSGSRARGEPVLVVPSGQVFELVCEVDTSFVERMNLDKLAQVRLRSDSPTVPFLTFELHLVVERLFRAVPLVVDLGRIPRGAGRDRRTDVSTETRGAPARITGIESIEGPFTASVDETETNGERFWIVVVSAPGGLALGPVRGKVRLSTSGADGTGKGMPFDIQVTGTVVTDLVATPSVFALGSFPAGTSKTCSVTLEALAPGVTFRFTGATVDGERADLLVLANAAVEPTQAGNARSWTLTLTAPSDLPFGTFAGTVEIRTDHPDLPSLRVPYNGNATQ